MGLRTVPSPRNLQNGNGLHHTLPPAHVCAILPYFVAGDPPHRDSAARLCSQEEQDAERRKVLLQEPVAPYRERVLQQVQGGEQHGENNQVAGHAQQRQDEEVRVGVHQAGGDIKERGSLLDVYILFYIYSNRVTVLLVRLCEFLNRPPCLNVRLM